MGIQRDDTLLHYNYFLALEEDLERLSRYVDFASNDSTYSIEIARILMTASAECDVMLKQLCKILDANSTADKIGQYYETFLEKAPDFFNFEVTIPRFGLTFTPWIDWSERHPPFWWSANNKVKHHRYEHFDQATLKHALNASAGLFIAVLHFYRQQAKEGTLSPMASLFSVPPGRRSTMISGRQGVSCRYIWPGDDPLEGNHQLMHVVNGRLQPENN